MSNYELTVVLPGDSGSAKVKSFLGNLEKIVTGLKGKLGKADEWGKIDLTYPIKGNKAGYFVHFDVELEPTSVKGLNDKFKLDDDIIRSLLVKKEK